MYDVGARNFKFAIDTTKPLKTSFSMGQNIPASSSALEAIQETQQKSQVACPSTELVGGMYVHDVNSSLAVDISKTFQLAFSSGKQLPEPQVRASGQIEIQSDTSPEGNATLVAFFNALPEYPLMEAHILEEKPIFHGSVAEQANQIRNWFNRPEVGCVRCLNLANKNITALPPEFGKFTALLMVILDGNRLETLPSSIGNCRGLSTLLIANNRLISLPDSIRNLKKLFHLDLSNNRIQELPIGFVELSGLEELKLGNNDLTFFPPGMHKLKSLGMIIMDDQVEKPLPHVQQQFETQYKANINRDVLRFYEREAVLEQQELQAQQAPRIESENVDAASDYGDVNVPSDIEDSDYGDVNAPSDIEDSDYGDINEPSDVEASDQFDNQVGKFTRSFSWIITHTDLTGYVMESPVSVASEDVVSRSHEHLVLRVKAGLSPTESNSSAFVSPNSGFESANSGFEKSESVSSFGDIASDSEDLSYIEPLQRTGKNIQNCSLN